MRTSACGWILRWACLTCLLAWTGCGDGNPPVQKGVVVKGKIVRDGKPLEVPNRDIGLGRVELLLIMPGTGGELESALAEPDGTFVFMGPGKGVAAGSYKLVVLQQDKGFQSDMLEGAFSEANTPIQVTIPQDKLGDTHDLGTIDLATYLKPAAGS